jgi:hypothetical protein
MEKSCRFTGNDLVLSKIKLMKHLYSLAFLLFALASSNLVTAQIIPNVTYTNDNTMTCSGTASATATGGAGGYVYMWSNGATGSSISGLCAGSYYVIVQDAAQDTASFSFTITNPCSNFTSTISATDCAPGVCDGTVSFMPLGGSAPYTYSWSNGAGMLVQNLTNVCPGTYTVVCTDVNGCTLSATATVTDPSLQSNISANLTSMNDLTGNCSGSASVAPTGGSGSYTYQWSNGATTSSINNLCVGGYYVLVTDSNLDTASVNFVITNPCSNFHATAYNQTNTGPVNCVGSAYAYAYGGTTPYTYSWSNGLTTDYLTNLCVGTYSVICTDNNGCTANASVTIQDTVSSVLSLNLTSTDDLTNTCSGSASVAPTGGSGSYFYYWSNGDTTNSVTNLCAGIYSVTAWSTLYSDSTTVSFVIADSSSTYSNNPYPNGTINDTLYTDLVTNCIIDYNTIDSAALYQAVYNSSNQSLYVTWVVYSPTDTVYISDTLALIGNPGYYSLTISVYCPNKSINDFFQIESVIYFDGSAVWTSTLGLDEQHLLDNVTIYPNPFNNSISVDNTDGAIQSVKLIDLNGRVISEMSNLNSGLVELNQLGSVSNGTYLLILSGENSSKTYKVIK